MTTVDVGSGRRDWIAERLTRMLRARSVALVGAAEKGPWVKYAFESFDAFGFDGEVYLVNRSGSTVFGRPTATSCEQIGASVDVAVLMVSGGSVPAAMADAAAAGIRNMVVLAADFADAGDEGRRRETELVDLARGLDVVFLGPNCIGFANVPDRSAAWLGAAPPLIEPSPVAVISQSGAMASAITEFAAAQHLAIGHLVTTGNQAMVDITDVMMALLGDERVRVLAVFAETILRPREFLDAAAAALATGRAIVMLKAGSTELAARTALSHTGALVGDDDVIDAALKSAGVVRVRSMEDLVVTAGLLAHTGVLPAGGLGLMAVSGGMADVAADRAESAQVSLPTLVEHGRLLGDAIHAANPLDLTGLVYADHRIAEEALELFGRDPGLSLVGYVLNVAPRPGRATTHVELLARVGRALQTLRPPGIVIGSTLQDVGPDVWQVLQHAGVPHFVGGLDHALQAIGHVLWWSGRVRRGAERALGALEPSRMDEQPQGPWSESRALQLLADHGVPVVPWRLVATPDEAAEAAKALGYPVVVKVASPDIAHKSRIGGVVLGIPDDAGVRDAFERVVAAGRTQRGANVESAIVATMRPPAVELLVGVVRDPQWGLVLAVGLGGTWVDTLDQKVLRLLPVEADDVEEMLAEAAWSTILGDDARARRQLAEVIVAIAEIAHGLGSQLDSLEVNPLRVGESIEALDALCVGRSRHVETHRP